MYLKILLEKFISKLVHYGIDFIAESVLIYLYI